MFASSLQSLLTSPVDVEPAPASPGALFLIPVALVVAASVYVPFGPLELGFVLVVGVAVALGMLRRIPLAWPSLPASGWSVISAVLLLGLCFAPLWRFEMAPGGDQAMYSAIARGMTDTSGGLSPAWGSMTSQLYPRGYPAILAALAPLVGAPKASLLAAAISLAMFACAMGFLFRILQIGKYSFVYAVGLSLLSRVPQKFFGSGSSATTISLAWGLAASGYMLLALRNGPARRLHIVVGVLCALAALVTHPVGAVASVGVGVVFTMVLTPPSRWLVVAPVPLALVLAAAVLVVWGPELSSGELDWIKTWVRQMEGFFRPAWNLIDLSPLRFFSPLGGLTTVVLGVGIVLGLAVRRTRGLSLLAMAVLMGFLGIEVLGPYVPALRSVVYPYRMCPALLVFLALPALAFHRTMPLLLQRVSLVLVLGLGAVMNWRYYQSSEPMASAADVAAIRCLDAQSPAGAIIDGAYRDAVQWIPVLTGRGITAPHVHISFMDEFDQRLLETPMTVRYRFVGSSAHKSASYDDSTGTVPFCRYGGARALILTTPLVVSRWKLY